MGGGGWGTPKKFTFIEGGQGKKMMAEGGSCNFLMTVHKIPPAPPPTHLVKDEQSLRKLGKKEYTADSHVCIPTYNWNREYFLQKIVSFQQSRIFFS